MLRQVLINILFYTGLPVSLLVFAAGMWRKRPGWGFALGFIPLGLMWLLPSPDLFPADCPAPCTPSDELGLVLGASILHLVFYTTIALALYVIIHYLIDPDTAVIKQTWQKIVVLFQIGVLGVVMACVAALNTQLIFAAVVELGRTGLVVLSHRWLVVWFLILSITGLGIWAVVRMARGLGK